MKHTQNLSYKSGAQHYYKFEVLQIGTTRSSETHLIMIDNALHEYEVTAFIFIGGVAQRRSVIPDNSLKHLIFYFFRCNARAIFLVLTYCACHTGIYVLGMMGISKSNNTLAHQSTTLPESLLDIDRAESPDE
jgi:hypothetical protein